MSEDIRDSILECIGDTPLVRLHRFAKLHSIECELVVKCEFLNAGGSVKDRIAEAMIQDAITKGQIGKDRKSILIEPTSGNTGIGLALEAAVRHDLISKCILTMPDKMSQEKVTVMERLGAKVIRTPNDVSFDDPKSHIAVARRLVDEINSKSESCEHAIILDQYTNPANPKAHYEGTATEIWRQCGEKSPAMLVMGAGTGGTVSGIAQLFRERSPNTILIGVDPIGSTMVFPNSPRIEAAAASDSHFYHVEGIGYDFTPKVLDVSAVDSWERTSDADSFARARELIRLEGLLVGGSCGAAMQGAIQAIRKQPPEFNNPRNRVIVILPDSIRNYLGKFASDDWMLAKGFMQPEVKGPILKLPTIDTVCLKLENGDESIAQVFARLQATRQDVFPVLVDAKLIGVLSLGILAKKLSLGILKASDPAKHALVQDYVVIPETNNLMSAVRMLGTGQEACLVQKSEFVYKLVDSEALLRIFLQ